MPRRACREETRLLPTPDVAGHDEAKRAELVGAAVADFYRRGADRVAVSRIKNKAFDKVGQRTTFRFVVRYPGVVDSA